MIRIHPYFVFLYTIVSLSQQISGNRLAVCPLETVKYICTANYDELIWYFNRTIYELYGPNGRISYSNDTILKTDLFSNTDIQITSTAEIESVLPEYNGLFIECYDIGGVDSEEIRVEGI